MCLTATPMDSLCPQPAISLQREDVQIARLQRIVSHSGLSMLVRFPSTSPAAQQHCYRVAKLELGQFSLCCGCFVPFGNGARAKWNRQHFQCDVKHGLLISFLYFFLCCFICRTIFVAIAEWSLFAFIALLRLICVCVCVRAFLLHCTNNMDVLMNSLYVYGMMKI